MYWYVVTASSSAGHTRGESPYTFALHISGEFPNGVGSGPPYEPEIGSWTPSDQEQADRATASVEAERRHTKEQEEQKKTAQAAAEQALESTELKRRHEEEAKETLAREEAEHPACTVPALKGDTLAAARRALAKVHCRVGRVSRPRHRHGTLRVSAQAFRPGQQLPHGAPVALTLGTKRASRR